jgi:hypothetical protein
LVSESILHVVPGAVSSRLSGDYEKGARPQLEVLYEKAKAAQWDPEKDLAWQTPVDPEALGALEAPVMKGTVGRGADLTGTPVASWKAKEWSRFAVESMDWRLSQFLHGEQGALVCTARIVESVPWIDAKYVAATQVMDEARHVEVFARYVAEKRPGRYPINPHLGALLDDILRDSRWDMTCLGMQILVEGLALAAFGSLYQMTTEPLLKSLLRRVMADEARHVSFGVLGLRELYAGLSAAELKERQEFTFDATIRMRDRFNHEEVWERFGVAPPALRTLREGSRLAGQFPSLLFSRIVPNVKKLGLLDAGDGWLRDRFTEIGVVGYEESSNGDPRGASGGASGAVG